MNSMKKGLIGWLGPDGTFYECQYREHHKLVHLIGSSSQDMAKHGFVYFGRDSFGTWFIFINKPLTIEQTYWFWYNQDKLSTEQREMWEWYCENGVQAEVV